MCEYALEWLDALITNSLNPLKTDLNEITPEQVLYITFRIKEEKTKCRLFLQKLVFSLLEEEKIKIVVKQYYSTLVLLLDQVWHDESHPFNANPSLKDIRTLLIVSLEELLSFIETRFSYYLSLEERAPSTYLVVIKNELSLKINSLKPALQKQVNDLPLTDILFNALEMFFNKIENDEPLPLSEVLYMKELVKKLQELSNNNIHSSAALNKLLIYLNFNCKAYIEHFTNAIIEKIYASNDITKQLQKLLFYRKDFNQINSKADVSFNPHEKDLKIILGNWFNQEVQYLERKLDLVGGHLPEQDDQQSREKGKPVKVKCALSVDQLSLIIRAADESRLITARSLNAVFKQITPYLSTINKENVSADSMRSKSYAAEAKDKDVSVQVLERLIEKIKEY